jgi:hypothetical protein
MNHRSASILGRFFFLVAIVLTGCATPPPEEPKFLQPTQASLPAIDTVQNNIQVALYDEWPGAGFPDDASKIISVTLENNTLTIKVVYQGGCREHGFTLYAEAAFLLSQPPQGELYLSHDAHGDPCAKRMEKTLAFDLTPLNKERNDPGERPLLLRIFEPMGGSFADDPVTPLIEWP